MPSPETPSSTPQKVKYKKPDISLEVILDNVAQRIVEQNLRDPTRRAAIRRDYTEYEHIDDSVDALPGLSNRTAGIFTDLGFMEVYQLISLTRRGLLALPRCGEYTLDETLAALHKVGLPVKDWTPPEDRETATESPAPPATTEDQVTTE